jgi:hypothetical protein
MPQRYCFVMMPFTDSFNTVYTEAIRPAIVKCQMDCIRADEDLTLGGVVDRIQERINSATLCIADLTENNPNVFFEVGLANAATKPTILIAQNLEKIAFDVRHLRAFSYSSGEWDSLRIRLENSIRAVLGSDKSILEEMLVPANLPTATNPRSGESPFFITANPLSIRAVIRLQTLQRTSSDHVAIRGLIHAFGLILDIKRLPELVNPDDYLDTCIMQAPKNIYCIGSPKANHLTGVLMREFNRKWHHGFEFKADPSSEDLRNVRVMVEKGARPWLPESFLDDDRHKWDFGLIIRGPHPFDSQRMFMIIAGRSTLGTQAAALAVTDPRHASLIKDLLSNKGVDLNNYQQPFWAVALMKCRGNKGDEADLDTLEIPQAEKFLPRG